MNSKMCPNVQTLTLLCGHEQENVYIATALSLIIIIINADDNSQLSRHSVSRLWFIYTKLSISFDRITILLCVSLQLLMCRMGDSEGEGEGERMQANFIAPNTKLHSSIDIIQYWKVLSPLIFARRKKMHSSLCFAGSFLNSQKIPIVCMV